MTRPSLRFSIFFVIGALAACGGDTAGPTGDCSPGETMTCDCSATSAGTMTCGADSVFGACGQCSIPDPDPQKVNFQAQIAPIFAKSCGTGVNGCHGRDAFGANAPMDCRGWLTLENESLGAMFYSGTMQGQSTGCPDMSLYERLMTLAVWQCTNGTTAYVKSGDVAGSYLMDKINGTNLCKESASSISEQMPPPQVDNPTPFRLSAADKALIEQWISEGALDN